MESTAPACTVAATQVRLAFLWRPRLPDADDDMVFEAAINGQADRLVTFNQRHFAPVGVEFGIIICRPSDALAAMEAGS
jgi:hypothetical protein